MVYSVNSSIPLCVQLDFASVPPDTTIIHTWMDDFPITLMLRNEQYFFRCRHPQTQQVKDIKVNDPLEYARKRGFDSFADLHVTLDELGVPQIFLKKEVKEKRIACHHHYDPQVSKMEVVKVVSKIYRRHDLHMAKLFADVVKVGESAVKRISQHHCSLRQIKKWRHVFTNLYSFSDQENSIHFSSSYYLQEAGNLQIRAVRKTDQMCLIIKNKSVRNPITLLSFDQARAPAGSYPEIAEMVEILKRPSENWKQWKENMNHFNVLLPNGMESDHFILEPRMKLDRKQVRDLGVHGGQHSSISGKHYGQKLKGISIRVINGIMTSPEGATDWVKNFSAKLGNARVNWTCHRSKGLLKDLHVVHKQSGAIKAIVQIVQQVFSHDPKSELLQSEYFWQIKKVDCNMQPICHLAQMIMKDYKELRSEDPNPELYLVAHSRGGLDTYLATCLLPLYVKRALRIHTLGSARFIEKGIFAAVENHSNNKDSVSNFFRKIYQKGHAAIVKNTGYQTDTLFSWITDHFLNSEGYEEAQLNIAQRILGSAQSKALASA